jgi:hypothetical protein
MGRVSSARQNYPKIAALAVVLAVAVLAPGPARAQVACPNGADDDPAPAGFTCPPGIPLPSGYFQATPLIDGTGQLYPPYDNTRHTEVVSLYGQYGNDEQIGPTEAQAHYALGLAQANKVQKLALDGTPSPDGSVVVPFFGFSNCEIEICGGNEDFWHLQLQPCATNCNNPMKNPQIGYQPWNTAPEDNPLIPQQSLLWQAYSPDNGFGGSRVGQHVYLFNGAKGKQPLANWDPVSPDNGCKDQNGNPLPECNYIRVHNDLINNGFSDNQVQVIFLYDSTNYPQCDLSGHHCNDEANGVPDAYKSEQLIGDIMRYLKKGYNGHPPRYPNLQQVFIMSRNYGGYAKNPPNGGVTGCVSPEPFTYEEGFAVQRLTVAQIKQNANITSDDSYSSMVRFSDDNNNSNDDAPWFDWGPYLWASGKNARIDGLFWCNDNGFPCTNVLDFRNGDPASGLYGDLTHPRHSGQGKAAAKILDFILNSPFAQHWLQQ